MHYRDTLSDTNLADLGIIMSQIRRKVRTLLAANYIITCFPLALSIVVVVALLMQ
jgi:hypothetical protein